MPLSIMVLHPEEQQFLAEDLITVPEKFPSKFDWIQVTISEKSGLKEWDIIIQINSNPVHNLKDLSDILKSLKPGNKVSTIFMRNSNEMKVESEAVER